jgi:hypothetical protein
MSSRGKVSFRIWHRARWLALADMNEIMRRSENVGLRLAGRRAAERMTGTTYWLGTLLPKYPARFAGIPTTSACRQGCTLHEPELSTENVDNYTSCPSPTLAPILDSLP